ncbi:MAG: hypothetical protein LUG12_00805 [Erysipelotrichaceae bacterium]|nr:hypothetical protein [Erysipelotrichaceae bacterium]
MTVTKKVIHINYLKPKEGMVAHELGHAFVNINNLYENDELKVIMQDVLDNSTEITPIFVNDDEYACVKSYKFIREYQGRTYILYKDYLNKKIKLDYTELEEYISCGFEMFVINPKLLYTKDKELYDFIKKGGLTNESV